ILEDKASTGPHDLETRVVAAQVACRRRGEGADGPARETDNSGGGVLRIHAPREERRVSADPSGRAEEPDEEIEDVHGLIEQDAAAGGGASPPRVRIDLALRHEPGVRGDSEERPSDAPVLDDFSQR